MRRHTNTMRRDNRWVRWRTAAGLMLCLAGAAHAQRSGAAGASDPATGLPQTTPNPTLQTPLGADQAARERTSQMAIQAEKTRNDERQKKLVADTDKLLALATELKADVDKTNKDMLSIDVVKKADEIEKLAHSVKEKMKGS